MFQHRPKVHSHAHITHRKTTCFTDNLRLPSFNLDVILRIPIGFFWILRAFTISRVIISVRIKSPFIVCLTAKFAQLLNNIHKYSPHTFQNSKNRWINRSSVSEFKLWNSCWEYQTCYTCCATCAQWNVTSSPPSKRNALHTTLRRGVHEQAQLEIYFGRVEQHGFCRFW